MKEKQLTITGLVFTVEGRRAARGSLITGDRQSVAQALRENILQLGRIHYEQDGPALPQNRACTARLDGEGEYWLTLAPERFLLREAPPLEEERHRA